MPHNQRAGPKFEIESSDRTCIISKLDSLFASSSFHVSACLFIHSLIDASRPTIVPAFLATDKPIHQHTILFVLLYSSSSHLFWLCLLHPARRPRACCCCRRRRRRPSFWASTNAKKVHCVLVREGRKGGVTDRSIQKSQHTSDFSHAMTDQPFVRRSRPNSGCAMPAPARRIPSV